MQRISTLLSSFGRGPAVAIALAAGLAFGFGIAAGTHGGGGAATIQPVQDGMGEMDPEAMMEMYMQAGEPGEQHKALQVFVGDWDAKVESLMPGMDFDSTGTAKYESIMDGRFVRMDFHGDVMGTPMHGISIAGYHKALDRYESIWIDGTNTAINYSIGEKTDKGWVYEGDETDPVMKMTVPVRDTIDMHGKDKFVFTRHYPAEAAAGMGIEVEEGEDWVGGFRITYTRQQAGNNGMGGNNQGNNRR